MTISRQRLGEPSGCHAGVHHPRHQPVCFAVGETVILLQPPLPFSRRFNRTGEVMSAK